MFIIPIVCLTARSNRLIPPKARCSVCHFHFTLRLIPRNGRILKFSFRSMDCAAYKGIASVASPYRIPGHNLNLYAIHPRRAGRCPFVNFNVQLMNLPVIFFEMCSALLLSTVDRTPNDFSTVETSPWLIVAGELSGSGISIVRSGCGAYAQRPFVHLYPAYIQRLLSWLMAPPVALSLDAQAQAALQRPSCVCCSVVNSGRVMIKSVSSMYFSPKNQ
jgi:hypothetical protein